MPRRRMRGSGMFKIVPFIGQSGYRPRRRNQRGGGIRLPVQSRLLRVRHAPGLGLSKHVYVN